LFTGTDAVHELHLPNDLTPRGGIGTAQRHLANAVVIEVRDRPLPDIEIEQEDV